jgi:hypothetical protein
MAQATEIGAHLREQSFRVIPEAKQCLFAPELRPRPRQPEHFIEAYGMRSRLAGVFAKRAATAVVAAKVGQGNETFFE